MSRSSVATLLAPIRSWLRSYPRERLFALSVSGFVLVVSVLGAQGVVQTDPRPSGVASALGRQAGPQQESDRTSALAASGPAASDGRAPDPRPPAAAGTGASEGVAEVNAAPSLPSDSGAGRRVVFDQSDQRVWLVGAQGTSRRTYLVSGSRFDQLKPGEYEVYSRSRHAISYKGGATMQFMVRFARGERAAIGFHDIPVTSAGQPVQTLRQLGTRLSDGCIRQARQDAVALWSFAPVGTKVVVIA